MEKEKISAFEYAINDVVNPKLNEGKRPETEMERTQRRIDDLKRQAKGIKIQVPLKRKTK